MANETVSGIECVTGKRLNLQFAHFKDFMVSNHNEFGI